MGNRLKKQTGFTLIEVLIALVILAIALTAIVGALAYSIRDTSHVRDTLTANWVALNVLHEQQLGLKPPATGQVTMLGQSWRYQMTVGQKINVSVWQGGRRWAAITGSR